MREGKRNIIEYNKNKKFLTLAPTFACKIISNCCRSKTSFSLETNFFPFPTAFEECAMKERGSHGSPLTHISTLIRSDLTYSPSS